MQSYGEGEIQANDYTVGRVRVRYIRGSYALFPSIMVTFGITLREIPASEFHGPKSGLAGYEMEGISGELKLSQSGELVGSLRPTDRIDVIRSSAFDHEHQVEFGCDLSALTLERLEDRRNGGRMDFVANLWPIMSHEGASLRTKTINVRFEIPRDHWAECLAQLRIGDWDVLEVRRPTGALDFRNTLENLRVAQLLFDKGEYDAALVALRTALEQVIQAVKATQAPLELKDMLIARTDQKRGELYTSLVTNAKNLCSRAVHEPGATDHFSRAEARYILRMIESQIALLGELFPAVSVQ